MQPVTLLEHVMLTNIDLQPVIGPSDWLWLRLSDGRVLVLHLPISQRTDAQASVHALAAQLADDPRGVEVHALLHRPRSVSAALVNALSPAPQQALRVPAAQERQASAFAAQLDAPVMTLLQDLSRQSHRSWVSVRNYNRLVLLPEPLRERRFQALRRFGALVAPVLLTAHERPRLAERDAWRDHDEEVLEAIDRGRDLAGTLATHYGIGRALVRAPLCQQPWPAGGLALPLMLALIDGVPPSARPQRPAEWAAHGAALEALATLAGQHTQVLRALGAAVFRPGWQATWGALLRHHHSTDWPLARRLLDLRDFLAASMRGLHGDGLLPLAPADATQGEPRDDGQPGLAARLALLWAGQRGLGSLLRASQRWHDWLQQARPPERRATDTWPALLGACSHAGASAHECLSAADLAQEGQTMQHCVGSYEQRCAHHGQRVLHLSLPDAAATLLLAPLADDAQARFALAELLGPHNAAVSRSMQAWARWVLRRVNRTERLPERQCVLAAAALARSQATRVVTPQPLVAIDPHSQVAWRALLADGLPQAAPSWRAGLVLLDAELAGVDHHAAADCWEQLASGQWLTLVREKSNRHDPQAVRVDSAHGCLGYLPRPRNQRVALALDDGIALQARLSGLSDRSERGLRLWVRIKVAACTLQ